jgi:farnesyl diphosphate synthase
MSRTATKSESKSDASFAARLNAAANDTEQLLDRLLAAAPVEGEIARPPRVTDAMRYSSLGGGKRLRPFLTVETAALFGVDRGHALMTGAAIELVHCYSLVHDDLPAMDDDDLRRGRPTAHKKFDEATAILAGDALLTLAFATLADPRTHAEGVVRSELVATLAHASGLGGMAGGQMLDLQAENAALDAGEIALIQAMKTGALIAAACEMGAILGGADPESRAMLGSYGRDLGLAFQIADDLLDAASEASVLGKAAGKDAARGKATFVSILGVQGAREELDRTVAGCVNRLAAFGPDAAVLAQAARFAANREA